MPWISRETKAILAKTIDEAVPLPDICPCNNMVTLAFSPKSILVQTDDFAEIFGDIVDYNHGLGTNIFVDHPFRKTCQHVPVTSIQVIVNKAEVERIMDLPKVLIYHAKVVKNRNPITIETRGLQTGILDITKKSCDVDILKCGEIFAGGFSGWTHVTRAISNAQVRIEHTWAIERDFVAATSYVKTHPNTVFLRSPKDAYQYSHENHENDDPSCRMYQVDVQDGWFLSHLRAKEESIVVWSPPCQPWSAAHSSQGFNKMDGLAWVHALIVISFLRPLIFILEEVSQFGRHEQMDLVMKLIAWSGYDVVCKQIINLKDILPQNRERVIIIAIDRYAPNGNKQHVWEHWPITPAMSIRNSRVIAVHEDQQLQDLIPDPEIIKLYMSKNMLPKKNELRFETNSDQSIRNYRIKHPNDPCFSCIMANYRKAHHLPIHVLEQGGLYGSFIQDGPHVRFLSNQEIYMMMGALHEGNFPISDMALTHILGNCISVPHACIALLNGIKIIDQSSSIFIPGLFTEITSMRLKAEAIYTVQDESGFMIRSHTNIQLIIEPTQSHPVFVTITIKTPTTMIQFFVRSGLRIKNVVTMLMGPSTPKELWIVLPNDARIPLSPNDIAEDFPIVLWANIPSILSIADENLRTFKMPFVIVLTAEGPIALCRTEGQLVYQVKGMICDFFPELIEDNLQIVDAFGIPLEKQSDCPDMIFCLHQAPFTFDRDEAIRCIRFSVDKDHLRLRTNWKLAFRILKFFNGVGLDESLKSLGWAIQMIPNITSKSHCIDIIIAKIPDALSVPREQMQMCAISRMMVRFLPVSNPNHDERIHVSFKLWDSWVWNGCVTGEELFGSFSEPWIWASEMFASPSEIRLVCKGKNITPETTFKEMASAHENIRLHAVFHLHGGGNKTEALIELKNHLAVFMLNHGADLGETTTLIDSIAKSEGLQTMKNLVKIQDDKQKIEALTQVAGKIRIKFPHFPKSQQAMVNKTKEWAGKKNLQPVQPVTASHFELIPDVFRNEDKTVPSIKTSMTTGMSGIILLDHDAAAPWISEPTIVSSDECGVIVLGHKCPSNDPKRCCKIQIPVKSSNSQTAIVAACLHNVGQKKICVFKDDNIEKIDVKKGAILAITIFRDELQVDEWEFVSQHPVKFALQSIGFGDESFFLGAPWGRSWISQGKKCQPIAAASVQFHVRVDESKVEPYMKASGSNGVYITPKTSNNVVDPNFAIIWVDMTPIELTQLLVKYPQHLGIVRVTKEKSSTIKTSRGVRCKRDDFAAFFQQLRPGDTLPDTTPIQCLYKIQPIPLGAKVEDIAKWMKLHSWEGRPIKALNDRTWLVGSKVSFNHEFLFWNEQSVLIKPVQSKAQHPISPVVAGHIPRQAEKPSGTSSANGSDPWNKTDPWARYTPLSSNASVVQPRTAAPPAATRSVDAPTEARFQQQGEKVSQLAEAVKELQTKFDKREEESTRFEAQVHNEFALVRSEVSSQFSSMSKGFQVSMEKALEKQDRQMSQAFLELKQLIRMNNQPNPAKKAKAVHPQNVEDIEVDQEGDQHGDH